jgi:hypothetical protein
LSYHDYAAVAPELVTVWKDLAAANGRGGDFPVYITEWNYTAGFNHAPIVNDHPDAISFQGTRHKAVTRIKGRTRRVGGEAGSWCPFGK